MADAVLAGRYRLGVRLGKGGMGEVWSAVHVVTGRRVAIKRLLISSDQDHEGEARARFVREAQTACAVEHTNVVEILDFVEAGDEPPLLVMERLSGETLSDLLLRTPSLDVERAARLLLPVVSAVGTAHSRGIVHRDLKPANIFLHERTGDDPLVKVLDFGIAKWVAAQANTTDLHTRSGSTLGTPCYMAPEQALGERAITHRADIWSLGVIFYECLVGSRPVEGENAAQVVMNLLHTGIIPIERLVPTIPNDLARLVGRMLTRDPAERPENLREAFQVLSSHTRASAPEFGEPAVNLEPDPKLARPTRTTSLVAWAPRTPPSASGSADTEKAPPPSDVGPLPMRKGVTFVVAGLAILALFTLVRFSFSTDGETRATAADVGAPPGAANDMPAPPIEAPRATPSATSATANSDVAPPPPSAASASSVRANPTKPSRPTRPARGAERAPVIPAGIAKTELPVGSRCERSRECASGLCVAFTCQ